MDDPLAPPPEHREPAVLRWLRAVVEGVQDTAKTALEAGREEAARAYDEAWQRYDAKTRYRRSQPSGERRRRR